MSQAARISRIHYLIKTNGQVTTRQIAEEFGIQRSTMVRDIQLMRDQLRAPIVYDPQRNAYVYGAGEDDPWHYRSSFDLPGLWLDQDEAYALLTLLNVTGGIDPGLLGPYVAPLKAVLKKVLGERQVPMKGFHKKVAIDLPNMAWRHPRVVAGIGQALAGDQQVAVEWRDDSDAPQKEVVSLQRFVLGASGWTADFVVDRDGSRRQVPLARFTSCKVTGKPSNLLPEFRSDPKADYEALLRQLVGRPS